VPKLKPETIKAKIDALSTELSELQCQRQQLVDSAADSPLIGQYIATKKSGGTAFSGQSEKQAAHNYYALVDAAGAFIRYVSKQEVAVYRDRIRLGKKVARLNRAIARCVKRIGEYESKLPSVEQVKKPTVAAPDSLPNFQDHIGSERDLYGIESNLGSAESAVWIVREAA